MESIFGILKENIQFIISLFSVIIGIRNFMTFVTSKPIERQLFSKEKKIIYDFINIFSLFILVPTLLFTGLFSDKGIMSFFSKIYIHLVVLLAFLSLIIIIRKKISKIRKKQLVALKVVLFNRKFEIVTFILIYLNIFTVFGSMNASLIFETIDLKAKLALLALFFGLELYYIYTIIVWGNNLKLTKPILVSIKMDDGTTYDNYYIYNPSDKNFILIGKDKNPDLYKTPILIKVDKIISVQQVHPIL